MKRISTGFVEGSLVRMAAVAAFQALRSGITKTPGMVLQHTKKRSLWNLGTALERMEE
jgi:hypothetical protein